MNCGRLWVQCRVYGLVCGVFLLVNWAAVAGGMADLTCSEAVFLCERNFFQEIGQKKVDLCLVIPNFVIFVHR